MKWYFTVNEEGRMAYCWERMAMACCLDEEAPDVCELSSLRSGGTCLLELAGELGDCRGSPVVYCAFFADNRSREKAPGVV